MNVMSRTDTNDIDGWRETGKMTEKRQQRTWSCRQLPWVHEADFVPGQMVLEGELEDGFRYGGCRPA
jgi:hypothetical protein